MEERELPQSLQDKLLRVVELSDQIVSTKVEITILETRHEVLQKEFEIALDDYNTDFDLMLLSS